jgi:hypothetical protein
MEVDVLEVLKGQIKAAMSDLAYLRDQLAKGAAVRPVETARVSRKLAGICDTTASIYEARFISEMAPMPPKKVKE